MGFLRTLFYQGQYQQVLEKTYEKSEAIVLDHAAFIVGSLGFLGRLREAEAFYQSHKQQLNPNQQSYCYFFLAISLIRRSQYKKAKQYLLLNKDLRKSHQSDAEISFLVDQGISFFFFFLGQFEKSIRYNQKSLTSAMATQDMWMKALAYDLMANNQMYLGQIYEGLRHFKEALKCAHLIKNQALITAFEVSELIAKCEFGINLNQSITELKAKILSLKDNDSFSKANLGLEYARQLTLQGRWVQATQILEEITPLIHQSQNRRQEVRLNLRWAELYYLKNEANLSLHYLRSGQLCLEFVDQTFEIQLLGLKLKVYEKLKRIEAPADNIKRFFELTEKFRTIKNVQMLQRENKLHPSSLQNSKFLHSDDKIHQALLRAQEGDDSARQVIFETGYFSWLYRFFELQKGEQYILLNLEPKSITIVTANGIQHIKDELSTLNYKILTTLKSSEITKEELVQLVWGYQYDPLRHDSLIYSSFSSLRKILGIDSDLIQNSEMGYRLKAQVINLLKQIPSNPRPIIDDTGIPRTASDISTLAALSLNARQIQIMQFLDQNQFISVKKVMGLFDTSEITANRDLRSLYQKELVLRIGQGRATQYSKRRSP